MNGLGNISLWSVKRLKRANRCILRQWKSWENVLVLWFIHILKTTHLQVLKEMLSSKLGMWKGYHLSMEGIRKGEFFCHKRYIKGWGIEPRGRASPYNAFLVPPGTLWISNNNDNNNNNHSNNNNNNNMFKQDDHFSYKNCYQYGSCVKAQSPKPKEAQRTPVCVASKRSSGRRLASLPA